MAKTPYVVVGRAPDCQVVMSGSSVSSRHARLRWDKGVLLVEDLGSANGTYVDGTRIARVTPLRVGQDVHLGSEPLPWDDAQLRAFLRHGASDTIVSAPRFDRYRCPKCKKQSLIPQGFKHGELTCVHCGAALLFGQGLRSGVAAFGSALLWGAIIVVTAGALLALTPRGRSLLLSIQQGKQPVPAAPTGLLAPLIPEEMRIGPSRTEGGPMVEEDAIRRSGTARRVVAALDIGESSTRTLAVQIAAKSQGTFSIEQVAAIWLHVRAEFDYVNDPRGREYFARVSETMAAGFAGDCDDFATTLTGMITAIGGRARVVLIDGVSGGHAYAEACLESPAKDVQRRLRTYVRKNWNKKLGKLPALTRIAHRADPSCPVWLNLDWNANYPGGPYAEERWAVAIESDGSTETLLPQVAEPPAKTASR